MEGSWDCTWGAANLQNAPKLTKIVTIALQSKLFWINPKWLKRSVSGLEGHMIWVRASYGGVIGHTWGALKCAKMHQNGPKWTKIVHNGQYIMTEQKCFEFVLSDLTLTYTIFLDASSHLYKVCPSVRPSVCQSVRPSVRPSVRRHFPWLRSSRVRLRWA